MRQATERHRNKYHLQKSCIIYGVADGQGPLREAGAVPRQGHVWHDENQQVPLLCEAGGRSSSSPRATKDWL
ncbi:hypothetical protein Nmel_013958 [Mimus melanotis]